MQIVLISWRTLGASELLLLPSLSFLLPVCVCFFPRVVCFLAVIVVVFEVLCPSPTQPPTTTNTTATHLLPSPTTAPPLPSSFRPSGLVAGFELSFMAAPTTPRRTNHWKGGWLGAAWGRRRRGSGQQTWEIRGHSLASQLWCGPEPDSVRCCCFLSFKRALTLGDGSERNDLMSLFRSGYGSGGSREKLLLWVFAFRFWKAICFLLSWFLIVISGIFSPILICNCVVIIILLCCYYYSVPNPGRIVSQILKFKKPNHWKVVTEHPWSLSISSNITIWMQDAMNCSWTWAHGSSKSGSLQGSDAACRSAKSNSTERVYRALLDNTYHCDTRCCERPMQIGHLCCHQAYLLLLV